MIVREQPDGSLILINQNDHAKLSGLMAAHWGNAALPAPKPWEAFVRAAAWHDAGWTSYEAAPIYDFERKAPPHFPRVPLDATQLVAYQGAIDWLWNIDAYAGLLISRHRTGLWKERYKSIAHPAMRTGRGLDGGIAEFIAANEARQEVALATLDRLAFEINYQLLQIVDLLSLYLCVSEPTAEHIDCAPNSHSGDGKSGVRLTLTPRGDGRIAIAPFPFDIQPLEVGVVCRRLPRREFASLEAFRAAYFGARPEVLTYTFV